MRISSALLIGFVAGALPGCSSYEQFVRNELKVPNVFIPPSADFTPYSIVAYSEESNFQTVCPASLLISPMKWDEFYNTYLAEGRGSPVATVNVSNSGTYSFDVKLFPEEVADIGIGYQGTYKIAIDFSNGRVLSANDATFTVGKLLRAMSTNAECADSLQAFALDRTKKQFMMVNSVFRYDTDIKIERTDNVTASAELPTAVKNVVLRKISLTLGGDGKTTINGKNLYVGFRGLTQAIPDVGASKGANVAMLLAASEARLVEAKAAEARAIMAAKAAEEARAAAEAKVIINARSALEAKSLAAERSAAEDQAKAADRLAAAARQQEAVSRSEGEKLAAEASAAAAIVQATKVAASGHVPAPAQPEMLPASSSGKDEAPNIPLLESATKAGPDGLVKAVDVTALVKEVVAVRNAQ